jgi:hypothetical protein
MRPDRHARMKSCSTHHGIGRQACVRAPETYRDGGESSAALSHGCAPIFVRIFQLHQHGRDPLLRLPCHVPSASRRVRERARERESARAREREREREREHRVSAQTREHGALAWAHGCCSPY